MKSLLHLSGALAALALSACATPQGPVEVTRFVGPTATAQLGEGTIFVEAAPGEDGDYLALAPYKSAVADELRRLGYSESGRAAARQIAQVRAERYEIGREGRRGPVSVGVGGSTGSYGSGVGIGFGIDLGGGAKSRIVSRLAVTIRDTASRQVLWEGRAEFATTENSPLAQTGASAQTLAAALFGNFPGQNGETIEVEVPQ